jgi:hypothetical protein
MRDSRIVCRKQSALALLTLVLPLSMRLRSGCARLLRRCYVVTLPPQSSTVYKEDVEATGAKRSNATLPGLSNEVEKAHDR